MANIKQVHRLTADVRQLLDGLEDQTLGMRTRRDGRAWWIVVDGDQVIGFAAARLRADGSVAFTSAGVLPSHRGRGLHRRLIRCRERWARRQGADRVEAYTADFNVASANNLVRCGWRLIVPARRWGCAGAIYFGRNLVTGTRHE